MRNLEWLSPVTREQDGLGSTNLSCATRSLPHATQKVPETPAILFQYNPFHFPWLIILYRIPVGLEFIVRNTLDGALGQHRAHTHTISNSGRQIHLTMCFWTKEDNAEGPDTASLQWFIFIKALITSNMICLYWIPVGTVKVCLKCLGFRPLNLFFLLLHNLHITYILCIYALILQFCVFILGIYWNTSVITSFWWTIPAVRVYKNELNFHLFSPVQGQLSQ